MKEVIAFDIGGTHLRAALVRNNKIIRLLKTPTPKHDEDFIYHMETFIEDLMTPQVRSIGIGIAGPVKNGKILNAPNLAVKNFDLKRHFEKKFKKKVVVANDAACFTRAQKVMGTKAKNFIFITIGTGIGGGIVIEGNEYRGSGLGAEFGHMYVAGDEWEHQWKKTKRKIHKMFTTETLVTDLCKKRSREGDEILEEAADYMGKAIASLISALDPEIVFLGGGIHESGEYFIKMIRKKTHEYMFLKKKTPIEWTHLSEPGILGASLLVS